MQQGVPSSPKFELPAQVLALSVGHLQLSERARVALREHETISGLVTQIESGRTGWTASVKSEISLVLDQLRERLRCGLEEGWDRFRRARRKMSRPMVIYFASFALDRLHPSVRDLPISTLHLSGRARASLCYAKIETFGDLIQAARWGVPIVHPGGLAACLQIIDILEKISQTVDQNGECDWEKFANSRRLVFLPCDEDREFVAENYLEAFARIVGRAARVQFGEFGSALINEYLLCAEGQQVSLIQIGNRFGMTSSTVSRVKDDIVSKLRGAFLRDDYAGCRFRFRNEFTWPIRTLGTKLLKTNDCAIPYCRWKRILTNCWLTKPDCLGFLERGILEILGVQVVRFDRPKLRPVILPLDRKVDPIRAAIVKAQRLLMRRYVSGFSRVELFDALKANNGELRDTDMSAILYSVQGVRSRLGDRQRFRSSRDFKNLADRLERELRKKGKPSHLRRLTRLINQRTSGTRKSATVEGILSADKRFSSANRTGFWSLTEWGHVEARTVAELAAVFLSRKGRPVTEAELFEWISARRKVRCDSIRRILRERKHQFSQVAPKIWIMAAQGLKSHFEGHSG